MTREERLAQLRELMGEPDLIDLQRFRGDAGTTWLLTVWYPLHPGEHTKLVRLPGGAFRNPRRLSMHLSRVAGVRVEVSDKEARVLIRLMHSYCDEEA